MCGSAQVPTTIAPGSESSEDSPDTNAWTAKPFASSPTAVATVGCCSAPAAQTTRRNQCAAVRLWSQAAYIPCSAAGMTPRVRALSSSVQLRLASAISAAVGSCSVVVL